MAERGDVRHGSQADICARILRLGNPVRSSSAIATAALRKQTSGTPLPQQKARLPIGCAILSTVAVLRIGSMPSEPYCQPMHDRPSDIDVSRQILSVLCA